MTLARAEFVAEARKEFLALPHPLQRELRGLTAYLLQDPFRSYPWLQLREQSELPGFWRFALGPRRVFYTVEGSVLLYVAISPRPPAYTSAAREEMHRRVAAHRHRR